MRKLNYDNNDDLRLFARALLLVSFQEVVKCKDIVLLEAGCDKHGKIDYLLFRQGGLLYKYDGNQLSIIDIIY